MNTKKNLTQEEIESFLNGNDPQERIVNIECSNKDNFVTVYYRDENDVKHKTTEPFYPFLWAKRIACTKLCDGDREEVKRLLNKHNIAVKRLDITNAEGKEIDEMKDGYMFMFYAKKPMSYSDFLKFFKEAKNPVYSEKKDDKQSFTDVPESKKESRQYLAVTAVEQYMISTGKRMFKGYEDYDDILRMIFDLESTGLNTETDRIEQFGIRFNRPVNYKGEKITFEKIFEVTGETEEEKDASELHNIENFLKIVHTFQPDVITAHNGETFDWKLIIGACTRLGTSIEDISKKYFNGKPIYKDKKETVLKLGGEIEKYNKTIVPGIVITDSLHAVRRAQAIDSNMLFSNLKYVTKYSKIVKADRVYVPGPKISEVWNDDTERYAFCEEDGDWYVYEPTEETQEITENKKGKDKDNFTMYTKHVLYDGYHLVSGKYVVSRYLLDDLWECDKVEHRYNTPNFLICKMLPVPFQKCCTMGTAGQWKSLMMAWSYENNLAIPSMAPKRKFTGGLSRLLRVGFVDNVVKLDYNSLYPSIILTWGIKNDKDLMNAMLAFLEHVLTQREKYKDLKKQAGKKADAILEQLKNREYNGREDGKRLNSEMMKWKQEESANDKKQLPLKILGNSFFGSYGATPVFPWGDMECAERTTCTGRQSLRLMISWFNNIGYQPIVGDSFSEDTPVFVKYDDNTIDIIPICELIEESEIKIDEFGREYDCSEKSYYVLCRSGWIKPSYIYRHKTDKDVYEVKDGDMTVEVTEDHSLFNSKHEKIKPSEITDDTKLEYYTGEILPNNRELTLDYMSPEHFAMALANGKIDRVPSWFLNRPSIGKRFYDIFIANSRDDIEYSKTCLAGLQFLKHVTK